MFPTNLSLTVLFILSFFHGDLFIDASPTTSSSSILPRTDRRLIGPAGERSSHDLEPLTTQGFFSRAFQVVGGYKGTPAILKLVPQGPNPKTTTELDNLAKVGLYLWSETNNAETFFVMKDVRKDYPNPGDVKKLFPDWYLEDENMDVIKTLSTIRENLHNVLMDFAMGEKIDLMHFDCHMNNIYTDNVFENFMPVDWGPPDNQIWAHGVVPVDLANQAEMLHSYMKWLDQNLPKIYNLRTLSDILAARGKQLRPADAQLLAQQNI